MKQERIFAYRLKKRKLPYSCERGVTVMRHISSKTVKTLSKVYISELAYPVDGYTYNVQITRSVDGGKTYWYCGCGKYCKSLEEANAYAAGLDENVVDILHEPLLF